MMIAIARLPSVTSRPPSVNEHHFATVVAIDHRARGEIQHEERQRRHETHKTGVEWRAGEIENKERQRDRGDPRTKRRDELTGPEELEIAVATERR